MESVTGRVKWVLRAEGLGVLMLCSFYYQQSDFSWLVFGVLFFSPDLTFFAYLLNNRVAAIAYNIAHSYIGVALLALLYLFTGNETLHLLTIVWAAHIGFDRALGYGLKYSKGFGYTHLGVVGNGKQSSA